MEHNGQTFALVRLDRASFDHAAQTGFGLEGKHQTLKCESCHNGGKIGPARSTIKVRDLNHSFLGLRRECTSCHADRHGGQFGTDCARCHVQDAWKPAPGFDHSKTSFALTGQHERVACRQCHGPQSGENSAGLQPTSKFKGIATAGCVSCHTDPHRGGFKDAGVRGTCDTCHNTGGWKNNRLSASFEHKTTHFPLKGLHARVACEKCHKSADFSKPIPHERCANCHEDAHNGQFAHRAEGSDCSACHRETGFRPTVFNTALHRMSRFPLEGKHSDLACAECHKPRGRGAVYIGGNLTCSSCHSDYHGGEMASTPYANQCNLCHTPKGFDQTSFTRFRHAETRFPLTGKHATAACADCHKPLNWPVAAVAARLSGTPPPLQYRIENPACATCHADPHSTKIACESCHIPDSWQAVRPFDHASTGFRLEDSHARVRCILCHTPSGQVSTVLKRLAPTFANTSVACSGCHAATDPHGGQFERGERTEDCASCHTPREWKSPVFDHDKARLPLDIAHRNVTCLKCHKDRQAGKSKLVRTYRDTPRECVNCH